MGENTIYAMMIVAVALAAAFVVLLVKKWGWAEYIQVHGNEFFSKLFSCDLCMSFWAALCISVVLVMCYGDIRLVMIPVFSTPITRQLV